MMSLVQAAFEVVAGAQAEIAIFLLAIGIHSLLFGTYRIRAAPKSKLAPAVEKSPKSDRKGAAPSRSPLVAPLVRSLKPLLAQGSGQEPLARELLQHLRACTPDEAANALAGLLEVLGKSVTAELLAAVRAELRGQGYGAGGARACELLLRDYANLHLHVEFEELFREAEADGRVTPGMVLSALRVSLASSNLEAAFGQLARLAPQLRTGLGNSAPSAMPQTLVQQLMRLAIDKAAVPRLLRELQGCQLLLPWTFEALLVECSKAGDAQAALAARAFGVVQGVELTAAAYSALLRAPGAREVAVSLLEEAEGRGLINSEILLAAADSAAESRDATLATAALQRLPKKPAPEVAARFVRLAADGLCGQDSHASVLHLYKKIADCSDLGGDLGALQVVAEAALSQRQQSTIQQLVTSLEGPQRHALLKAFGARGGKAALAAATEIFKACPEKPAALHTALLDTCVSCQDMEAAERTLKEAAVAGAADVATYNTIIKAFAQAGELQRARVAVEEMRRAGGALTPNVVTFNELVDAAIRCGGERVWDIIEDMKSCNLRPTHVTCAILLKNIQRGCRARDIERTLAAVDTMDDTMDEVLLSSACEACVRVGRADLLAKQLKRQDGPQRVVLKGAHCFGSIVRAYGFLGDLNGAWGAWREMQAQRIVPTSVTIGCMVEALVSNGDVEAGHELIHQMLSEPETKPLVNAVIYCSVLKGFSHEREYERVWAVYDEMVAGAVPFSVAAFNALVDTCARSCDMGRVPDLIVDMGRQGIKPNVVTYSTILKGYCQDNRLDRAFEMLEEMKQSKEFRPDEITYNTLIDGCARFGYYDRGVALVEEMQEFGVRPSNFTLSVLAKLCTRSRRPEKAFDLCGGLAKKYGLRPNMQVYNNLIHACTVMKDMAHAAEVFEKMLREGVRTDGRTYSLMIKGYLACNMTTEAVTALRNGLGLEGSRPEHRPSGHLPSELVSEVLEAIAQHQSTEEALHLLRAARRVPGLKLDPKLQMRLTSTAVRRPTGA